jgi:hypothetical protein
MENIMKNKIEGIDLHILEQHETTLATLQKYLIVNNILTIDDLAVLTNGFMTNHHSDKVSEIAYNCLTLAQDEEDIISNVLEDDRPNSKIYYESSFSPGYKENREESIKAQMERNELTRAEAEQSYDDWINTEIPSTASTAINLRDLIIKKKKAAKKPFLFGHDGD